jgi:hypothetical protein
MRSSLLMGQQMASFRLIIIIIIIKKNKYYYMVVSFDYPHKCSINLLILIITFS